MPSVGEGSGAAVYSVLTRRLGSCDRPTVTLLVHRRRIVVRRYAGCLLHRWQASHTVSVIHCRSELARDSVRSDNHFWQKDRYREQAHSYRYWVFQTDAICLKHPGSQPSAAPTDTVFFQAHPKFVGAKLLAIE